MAFELQSTAFENGETIPEKHSRDGENTSPPLRWRGAPSGVRSFALVVEDPDAPSGTFRHWAAYNIPPERTELEEGVGQGDGRPTFLTARNDFGEPGYGGPQPPGGHGVHHYRFRLLALDTDSLNLANDASAEDVLDAAAPHVIDEADLMGTFER